MSISAGQMQRALLPASPLPPQLLRRDPRAFDHCFELCPLHLLVDARRAPALRETAIGAGDDVLAADEAREILEAQRDELGMLDDVGRMAEDAGDEDLAFGQSLALPDLPFVLVPGIAGL